MRKCIGDSVLFIAAGDPVGLLLERIHCVAHRNACSGEPDHGQIVFRVAESDHVLPLDPDPFASPLKRDHPSSISQARLGTNNRIITKASFRGCTSRRKTLSFYFFFNPEKSDLTVL